MLFPTYDLDDHLIRDTLTDGRPRVSVYLPAHPMVVLGRGSKPELEIHAGTCEAADVPVLRRRGGGCAVLLDPGNVIVSLTLSVEGIGRNREHFDRISAWIMAALTGLGLSGLTRRGISDLCLGRRKVGGSCIQRQRGLLYYSTTLLVQPDVPLMARVLRHPPREPEYRAGRKHAEFVGKLDYAGGAARLCRDLSVALDPATL